ncbi:PP2C family protein-serine/threonine phosphatase [Streptomyces sp. BI20]|uniref:PP2C family protein-serine/threonine phosphatase n=1 Tax=Streptomyces sp. BI20 TaxID=3403460 RepID=UPI003C74FF3D
MSTRGETPRTHRTDRVGQGRRMCEGLPWQRARARVGIGAGVGAGPLTWSSVGAEPVGSLEAAGVAGCVALLLMAGGRVLRRRRDRAPGSGRPLPVGVSGTAASASAVTASAVPLPAPVSAAVAGPVPPRALVGRPAGFTVAAGQLVEAGDWYAAVPFAGGVRVVIGDARGHGARARAVAGALLAEFRRAAREEAGLGGVALRMEGALERWVRARGGGGAEDAEEFATVLLLEVAVDGVVRAVNCGHPWPLWLPAGPGARARARRVPVPVGSGPGGSAPAVVIPRPRDGERPWAGASVVPGALSERDRRVLEQAGERVVTRPGAGSGGPWRREGGEPLPPLGVAPLPASVGAVDCGRIGPGEGLLLHTDGVVDARDGAGRPFALDAVVARLAAPSVTPARLVAGVHAALLRHTGGRPGDDVALLVLRDDRP